jgi:hypothetical protein
MKRLFARLRRLRLLLQSRAHARSVKRRLLRTGEFAPLTRSTRRSIRRHAVDVFSSAGARHWLEVYSIIHGVFRVGWIPDDVLGVDILPRANNTYRNLGAAKTLSRRVLQAVEFPDLAYRIHGNWFDVGFQPLTHRDVTELCFPPGSAEEVVVKGEGSQQGRAVTVLNRTGFIESDPDRFGNAVIQRRVRPHPELDGLAPGTAPTVRITTIRSRSGEIGFAGAQVRFGRQTEQWIQLSTSILVPVTDDRGTLYRFGFTKNDMVLTSHPDFGTVFEGLVVPHFASLRATCIRLHTSVPQFSLIGWDLVPDASGNSVVFEWNTGHPGVSLQQAILGPILQDLLAPTTTSSA